MFRLIKAVICLSLMLSSGFIYAEDVSRPQTTIPARVVLAKWFPSNDKMLFLSDNDYKLLILFRNSDQVITLSEGPVQRVVLSPDGTRILYLMQDGSLWLVNADGSGKTQLENGNDGSIGFFDISPDGKSIFYATVDSNNTTQCHFLDIGSRKKRASKGIPAHRLKE